MPNLLGKFSKMLPGVNEIANAVEALALVAPGAIHLITRKGWQSKMDHVLIEYTSHDSKGRKHTWGVWKDPLGLNIIPRGYAGYISAKVARFVISLVNSVV